MYKAFFSRCTHSDTLYTIQTHRSCLRLHKKQILHKQIQGIFQIYRRDHTRERERVCVRDIMKSGAFVDWISAWCMPLHALSMLYKCLNVYRQDVNAGQSGRPSYPGGLATATASLGNVGSIPHSSADLRVGTAVALASSVAKYWVLTNLFPGPLPQVSVYHSSHRSGGGGEASSSKEPASSLNQEMALTSSSHHQQQSTAAHHHHQPSVSSSSHHSSLQSNTQVCLLMRSGTCFFFFITV